MSNATALPPVGRDLYLLGVKEGFRLGYLAAGEVVAEGIGAARWRFREQIMTRHRRHFEERLARGVTDAVATLEARANQGRKA